MLFLFAICNAQDTIPKQTWDTIPFTPNDSAYFRVNIDSCEISYDTISGIVKVSGILFDRINKERLREYPISIGSEYSSAKAKKTYSFNVIDSTKTNHSGRFCVSAKIVNAEHLVFRCGIGEYMSYGKLDDMILAIKEKRVAPNQALKLTE
jgi:hypothetical protein